MSNGSNLSLSTATVPIIHTLKTLSRPSMDFFASCWMLAAHMKQCRFSVSSDG